MRSANRVSIQIARWLIAAVLLAGSLYFGHLAAYHVWAADWVLASGLHNDNAASHMEWATRFFWLAAALLTAAICIVWVLRKKK